MKADRTSAISSPASGRPPRDRDFLALQPRRATRWTYRRRSSAGVKRNSSGEAGQRLEQGRRAGLPPRDCRGRSAAINAPAEGTTIGQRHPAASSNPRRQPAERASPVDIELDRRFAPGSISPPLRRSGRARRARDLVHREVRALVEGGAPLLSRSPKREVAHRDHVEHAVVEPRHSERRDIAPPKYLPFWRDRDPCLIGRLDSIARLGPSKIRLDAL